MRRKFNVIAAVLIGGLMTGCASDSSGTAEASKETSAVWAESTALENGTQESTARETTAEEKTDNSYAVTSETAKLLGRTYEANGTCWLTYSGSGAEFSVTGTSASVVLYGDSVAASAGNDGSYARYAIYVDGERVVDDLMDEGAKNVTIFEGTEERTATVRIVKLSETAMSIMGIKQVQVTAGKMSPTEDKDLYIEFVGDSITCGYGVDDEDKTHSFSTATEDVTKAYAYKTAELLDADYSCVAISGYGIISGYSSDGKIRDSQCMPLYYDKLGFSYGTCAYFNPAETEWSFERQPDAVVINLGTNDSSYCGSDAQKQADFTEGYIDFLKQVREKNPETVILCTLGLMGDTLYDAVCDAVEGYAEETGDENVYTLHLDAISSDEGYAADWHPTEKTHTRAAQTVAEELRQILGAKEQ